MHLKDVPEAIFNGLRRYTFTTANIYVKECKKIQVYFISYVMNV